MKKKRKYTQQQKQAIIDDYKKEPRPLRLIAEKFNIPLGTLAAWIEGYTSKAYKPQTENEFQ